MTDVWKSLVKTTLEARGLTQRWLEQAIGAGRGQIAKMLSEEQNTSVWVMQVCEALELPPPGSESDDERALLENFRSASPEGRQALLQHAASAAGVAGKRPN